jgi:hypothetical protein
MAYCGDSFLFFQPAELWHWTAMSELLSVRSEKDQTKASCCCICRFARCILEAYRYYANLNIVQQEQQFSEMWRRVVCCLLLMNDELGMVCKKEVVSHSRKYPGMCWETEGNNHDSWYPHRY